MPSDRSLKRLLLQWGLLWSLIIAGSLLWNEHLINDEVLSFANIAARNTIAKDLTFRRWVTMHGGVYVKPTKETPPNLWLKVPKRDILTTDGDRLTLMNPAYVARQAMSMFNEKYGTIGHITSLYLKNPDNAPDSWEREAMLQFKSQDDSATLITDIDGEPHYRLILPMIMEKGCLYCHADTGIPEGGIRGAISTSVPLKPMHLEAKGRIGAIRLGHLGIWMVGMLSIGVGTLLYDRQQRRREEAEEQLQESAMFLRESQEIARLGGWKSNPDTGLLRCTEEMYTLLDFPADHPLTYDSGFAFVDPEDKRKLLDALRSSWESGSGFTITCRMKTFSGRVFWADIHCVGRIENHNGSYLVGTLQDITTYKQAEEMMRFAKESAEATTRTKNELLAVISHELRTPLNGVIGGAQLLGMTELSADQHEYLQMIEISAGNELALVNDLLDLASLDATEIKILEAPFVLMDSFMAAIAPHRTVVEERGLTFKTDLPQNLATKIIGDGRRLTQIVSNLLGNAVKFTHQGEIGLAVYLEHVGEDTLAVRIVVSDTGIGIEEKDRERIFEPFVQADMSHTRSYGGTGLGLSICSKLVQRMGGRIGLDSDSGKGSTFFVELSFTLAPKQDEPEPQPTEKLSKTEESDTVPAILVAEDNPINLKATAGMLRKMGYRVLCATDGKEALTHWMTGGITLILMDIQMPVMDGIEALQFIRRKELGKTEKTLVVALTAHAMQNDRERLLNAGFDGYLPKPVDAKTLGDELKRVMKNRSDKG